MSDNLLSEILADIEASSPSRFLLLYTGWYLIGSPGIGDAESIAYQTNMVDQATVRRLIAADHEAGALDEFVLEIKKNPNNAFAEWISVGRATNNDVVLRYPGVSKLHARFEAETDADEEVTGYFIIDGGSTSRTLLNGQPLTPGEPAKLQIGDSILFGSVPCIVADAELLWQHFLR